jgi:acyl-CoA hydrolase
MDNTLERPRIIIMAEIMTPDMTNFSGNIHGGHLMRFFDKVAYACAVQYSGMYVVTLSVDHIFFKEPIYVGDLVTCYASINYVGNSSMEVGIRAEAENLMTRQKRHTNSCYFTMVALGEDHKPAKAPPLTLQNEIEKRRFEAGKLRKEMRMEYYRQHHQD